MENEENEVRELRRALTEAIRECQEHNWDYKWTTPEEMLARWRRLVADPITAPAGGVPLDSLPPDPQGGEEEEGADGLGGRQGEGWVRGEQSE